MKNTITRTAAVTGTSLLAAVLLAGCGGTSTPATSAASPANPAAATSSAPSPVAVPATGSAKTADTTSGKAPTGEASTLHGFQITAKRTPSASGQALLEVTAAPVGSALLSWTRNGQPYTDPYTARFTFSTVTVADQSGTLKELEHDNSTAGIHRKFTVPAGTDSVSVTLALDVDAVRKDPTGDPSLASLAEEVSQRYNIPQLTIALKPDSK